MFNYDLTLHQDKFCKFKFIKLKRYVKQEWK